MTKTIKFSISFLCLLFIVSCGPKKITEDNFADLIEQEYPPVITFEEQVYNFGKVIEGETVEHKFKFTNTGKGVLMISNVTASCGCTVPKNWPKERIEPGESAYVEAYFNTEGRVGIANKVLTVTANTKPSGTKVSIQGTVVGPESTN